MSVSVGTRRPRWRRASGNSTVRLSAVRMRRSRSALLPESAARSSCSVDSSRAARIADVWRAITTHATTRNATSQNAAQWRPLSLMTHLESAKPGGARAGIGCDFRRGCLHAARCEHPAQWPPAAGAHRLFGRADARARPLAERVLRDPVLTRVIADDAQPAPVVERVAQRREGALELLELLVHRDAQGLKQPGEI